MNAIPPKVITICQTLQDKGFEAWLVGGAVRDLLLQRSVHDWDFATNATPEQIQRCFSHSLDIGAKHGTITVRLEGEGFEVTTYRKDGTYSDGRRPDSVEFSTSIHDDLARRDFTVNAIAFDPLVEGGGYYFDPYHGRQDLKAGILRTVGNAFDRFREDGLRLLRAVRFSATHNLTLIDSTRIALAHTLDQLGRVSIERIRDELTKIMAATEPSRAFNLTASTGMLGAILPEMLPMVGCGQNRYHEFDVWNHTMKVVDTCPASDPMLRFAALFHDIGKPASKKPHPQHGDATFYDHEHIGATMTQDLMTRLRFSSDQVARVAHLVRHHFVRYESDWSDAAVRRWMRNVGVEHIPHLTTLAIADIVGKGNAFIPLEITTINELKHRIDSVGTIPTSSSMLAVSGHHVMTLLNIPPGPKVGNILAELLERVTEDPTLNSEEKLLGLIPEVAASV
jgi:tRNA nucleotidyltransferase (CCA-adding enzyme)